MFDFEQIRLSSDLNFIERFKKTFNATLLLEVPDEKVRIYQATAQEWMCEDTKSRGQQIKYKT